MVFYHNDTDLHPHLFCAPATKYTGDCRSVLQSGKIFSHLNKSKVKRGTKGKQYRIIALQSLQEKKKIKPLTQIVRIYNLPPKLSLQLVLFRKEFLWLFLTSNNHSILHYSTLSFFQSTSPSINSFGPQSSLAQHTGPGQSPLFTVHKVHPSPGHG